MTASGRSTPAHYHSDIESSSNSRMSSAEVDVCFPTPNKKEEGGIDYDALEEYLLLEKKQLSEHGQHGFKRSLSDNMNNRRYSMYGDRLMVISRQ